MTRQLTAADTWAMRPRALELAILAGRCDQLLDLTRHDRTETHPAHPDEEHSDD